MQQKTITVKNMVLSALLIALAIFIPMISFRITLPYFTMTLASHVPVLLSMFLNPVCAVLVAVGSFVGFLFSATIEVALRALTHVIFAFVGAYMLKKNANIFLVLLVTMLLHAVCETLVMGCFGFQMLGMDQAVSFGGQLAVAGIIAGLTMVHHLIDSAITFVIYKAIKPVADFGGQIHINKHITL